jgi:hypothetical protein
MLIAHLRSFCQIDASWFSGAWDCKAQHLIGRAPAPKPELGCGPDRLERGSSRHIGADRPSLDGGRRTRQTLLASKPPG